MNKDKKPNNANNSANMRLVELSIKQNLLLWQISQLFIDLDKKLSLHENVSKFKSCKDSIE